MNRSEIQQYDTVSAVFSPQRMDDLVPKAFAMIGRRFTWSADWIVDEGFAYEGEWHMTIDEGGWKRTGVMWAPLCDLSDIRLLVSTRKGTDG